MTTKQKIEALGNLYKNTVRARDEIAVTQDACLPVEDLEQLLDFARKIAGEGDRTMNRVISGLRAVLENEVHTASGY